MDVDQANQYVVSGLDSTHFKIVRSPEELDDPDDFFHPDMCHQVFGENETIFGYGNVRINIFYDAITFQALVKIAYEDKIKGDDEQVADNLIEKLKPWLPDDYYTDETDFIKYMNNRKELKPFGEKLSSFKCGKREFEVYTCTSNEPNYQDFHQRMETLIVWYIDAANFIDIEDEKWRFFVLYEKITHDSSTIHYPVGYSTVYEYYCYPASRRYRISQFIVFAPYQCMGLGTELLKTLYNYLDTIENIHDITVEDPSEKFQSIRDYVDCKNCATSLSCFQLPIIRGDFSKEMINESREKFKLNEKQCRRVYEILRLLHTDEDNEQDFKAYKMLVKNRLNAPYKKQEQQNSKISKLIRETPQLLPDQRLRILEKDFQNLMKSYHHTIYRLSKE